MKTNPSPRFLRFSLVCAAMLALAGFPVQSVEMAPAPLPGTVVQNSIQTLDKTALENGKVVLRVGMKHPLKAVPAGFTLNNPPRIALDFPDTASSLGKGSIDVSEGAVRNLNVVQAGARTRLIVNLNKPASYETRLEGNTLLVTLQGGSATGTVSNVTQRFAETRADAPQQHSLKAIDFRRGNAGEGRVVIDLSDADAEIDIRTQGKNLIVDFLNTSVPRALERRLDVGDFATPVQMVETLTQGNNTRMTIEPKGLWEYSAYQADRQFIIDVKAVAEDPNKLVQSGKPGYAGEKLSLNFQNVEVRAVLQIIMDFTGLNIVTSDSVTGNLTLRLKDVPWDQALDIILNARGLDKRKNGNVIWVAPRDELALKEKLELEARNQIADLEPLQTEYYQLNYLRADHVKNILTGVVGTAADKEEKIKCQARFDEGQGMSTAPGSAAQGAGGGGSGQTPQILSKRGSATYELKKNVLIVNDVPSKHEEIRKVLAVIDVPAKQVVIESRIVLVDDRFSRQLGVRLGVQSYARAGGTGIGVSQNVINSQAMAIARDPFRPSAVGGGVNINTSGGTTEITTNSSMAVGTGSAKNPNIGGVNVNLPIANAAGALGMTLMNIGSGNLINLELSAMESDNRGKVVANPRVMTSNQRPAFIVQAVEIPTITPSTGTSLASFSYRQVGICLLVNPQILNNDTIVLDVEVNKDTLGEKLSFSGWENYLVDARKIKTQVLLNNGETAVLGGIFEQETRNDVEKVPLLGDIPILGNLFKTTSKREDKKELLIFITPKILNDNLTLH
jgi:type IV pilus assembly protein PilQ